MGDRSQFIWPLHTSASSVFPMKIRAKWGEWLNESRSTQEVRRLKCLWFLSQRHAILLSPSDDLKLIANHIIFLFPFWWAPNFILSQIKKNKSWVILPNICRCTSFSNLYQVEATLPYILMQHLQTEEGSGGSLADEGKGWLRVQTFSSVFRARECVE